MAFWNQTRKAQAIALLACHNHAPSPFMLCKIKSGVSSFQYFCAGSAILGRGRNPNGKCDHFKGLTLEMGFEAPGMLS